MKYFKHIIPEGYTILSNKNSDMVQSNLGACGTIVLANIYLKKDLRIIHIYPCIKESELDLLLLRYMLNLVRTPEELTKTVY